jgi:hypothetical protein
MSPKRLDLLWQHHLKTQILQPPSVEKRALFRQVLCFKNGDALFFDADVAGSIVK